VSTATSDDDMEVDDSDQSKAINGQADFSGLADDDAHSSQQKIPGKNKIKLGWL
jgi:hypothetical protein